MSDAPIRYWREDNRWRCARVTPDPLRELPGRMQPWWKHYGLRGAGDTTKAALEDLLAWERAAEVFREIY